MHFIEDYIRDNVLPEYGNTHTTTTVTSLQTTLFRHEARWVLPYFIKYLQFLLVSSIGTFSAVLWLSQDQPIAIIIIMMIIIIVILLLLLLLIIIIIIII